MLQRFLTPWRLKWYSSAILFALSVGYLICVFYGSGSITLAGRLGGDYPTFYSIGRIIYKGDRAEIYNGARQFAEQKPFMGKENTYLPFGYPPHVALVYLPLSILPYRLSYVIHTVIMVLALLLTLHLIRPKSALIDKHFMCAFTLAVSFFPIFRAITGGQNTVINMLLIALSWRAAEKKHEYRAGVYTGLMLFKPQFALPLIGVYLLSGRWRIGISSGVVAIILYIIGAVMIGPDWIAAWLEKAKWQIQIYSLIDKENAISWLGFSEAILGAGNQWALIIGWSLTILTIIGISFIWWVGGRKADLTVQIGLMSICLVLVPPHVIFYDMGLLLFTYVAIATKPFKRKIEILGLMWFLSWSQAMASFIGFSPLFFITVGTGALAAFTLIRPDLKSANSTKMYMA